MLGTLPLELLAQVAFFLELPGLCSLRLASRQLERQSLQSFASAAFSTIHVSFGAANLKWIAKIANHGEFRLAVRCLCVGKWKTGAQDTYEMGYGVGGLWPRLRDGRLDPQAELVRKFVESLSRFPNCATIVVTDDRMVYTYSSQYRGPDRHLSSADAVDLVLHSLSTSVLPSLRSFQTRIGHGLDWYLQGSIPVSAVASVDKSVTDNLEELTLELMDEDQKSTASLLHLVTSCPRLTKLRLFTNPDEHTDHLITHHIDNSLHSVPRLETLLLGNLTISETALFRLLSASSDTLRRVDFHGVKLAPGSWTAVLDHFRTAPFSRLRRLSVFNCRDASSDQVVAFCPLWKSGGAYNLQDVSFSFRISCTARYAKKAAFHITGAMFQCRGDNLGAGMALRAMAQHSHLCSKRCDAEPPCAEFRELMRAEKEGRVDGLTLFELWTGLDI